jgi:hypothetical protein
VVGLDEEAGRVSRTSPYRRRAMSRTPGSAGSSRSGCTVKEAMAVSVVAVPDGQQAVAVCCRGRTGNLWQLVDFGGPVSETFRNSSPP